MKVISLPVMAKTPSVTYPVRFEKHLYEALMADCKAERRSLASLMNILGEQYLREKGKLPQEKEAS